MGEAAGSRRRVTSREADGIIISSPLFLSHFMHRNTSPVLRAHVSVLWRSFCALFCSFFFFLQSLSADQQDREKRKRELNGVQSDFFAGSSASRQRLKGEMKNEYKLMCSSQAFTCVHTLQSILILQKGPNSHSATNVRLCRASAWNGLPF